MASQTIFIFCWTILRSFQYPKWLILLKGCLAVGMVKLDIQNLTDVLWSPSYFVSSVGGMPIEVLTKYIQNQENPSYKDGV